jgi:hypothetical protein
VGGLLAKTGLAGFFGSLIGLAIVVALFIAPWVLASQVFDYLLKENAQNLYPLRWVVLIGAYFVLWPSIRKMIDLTCSPQLSVCGLL